jgi:hypothetical protein
MSFKNISGISEVLKKYQEILEYQEFWGISAIFSRISRFYLEFLGNFYVLFGIFQEFWKVFLGNLKIFSISGVFKEFL